MSSQKVNYNTFIVSEIVKQQAEQIQELNREKEMLQKTVDKYKNLYYNTQTKKISK